jgi:hypothetical protein
MVSFNQFHFLDPRAFQVTMELHGRADQREPIIAFVFRWMAFNAWMAAVTGEERDFAMIAALAAEPRMCAAYDQLFESNEEFRLLVEGFAGNWPVLSVSSVRGRLGYDAFRKHSRLELLAACSTAKVKMQPIAWGGGKPSWEQLLRVIYQVRCNLFHGEKSEANARDRLLIEASNSILAQLVANSGCYEWTDQ